MQIVWWPAWIGIGLKRDTEGLARIYRWRLFLGFVELRRWK